MSASILDTLRRSGHSVDRFALTELFGVPLSG